MEAAGDFGVGVAEANGVVAERRAGGDGDVAGDCAISGDGQLLIEDGVILLIGDTDVEGGSLRQLEVVFGARAEQRFPVDGVAGAVDGAVGVDVRGPLAGAGVVEGPGHGRDGRELTAGGGDDPEAVFFGLL